MHILVQAFLHLILLSFNTLHSNATRLPLVHMDHKLSSPHDVEARMKRDAMRVASLTRRLAANELGGGFETDLQHSYYLGEYYAEVSVGTPPQIQTLVFDTGSEISWVNCRCDSCDDQQFDPKSSTSFADVGCDDLTCYKVNASNRVCDDSGRCTYKVKYGDGTQTNGAMAMENIMIGNTTVPNVPIGCSYKTEGEFKETGADGILGLGGGSLSLVSQSIGGMFSYCLGNSTGWLRFGYAYVPKDAKWASLISSPKIPSDHYYIDVVGISVGGEVLNISAEAFRFNQETGEGGVFIDTGTVVTQLAKGVYEALRDTFKEKMSKYTTVGRDSLFDTCYSLQEYDGLGSVQVPDVLFNISSHGMDPPIITLKANNVLVEESHTKVYCLAFGSSDSSLNILGSLQQQGNQITIDATRRYVGFGPGVC